MLYALYALHALYFAIFKGGIHYSLHRQLEPAINQIIEVFFSFILGAVIEQKGILTQSKF